MMIQVVPVILILLAIIAIGLLLGVAVLFYQGRKRPTGNAQYVALGSSFAAGIGLGPRAPGSPLVCMRSMNGYPQQLARMRGLALVDVSCSGATAKQVLNGGQVFLGPQLDALGPATELVTMTIGGNDIRYVGDLAMMAGSASRSIVGWGIRRFYKGPQAPDARAYDELGTTLRAILRDVRRRSPNARVVVLTYPTILPPTGSCPTLQLTEQQVAMMRQVGDRLAEVTRAAAHEAGATLIDLQRLGADHHACSAEPWVNGWVDAAGTQFHPTLAGSTAMAIAIADALDRSAQP